MIKFLYGETFNKIDQIDSLVDVQQLLSYKLLISNVQAKTAIEIVNKIVEEKLSCERVHSLYLTDGEETKKFVLNTLGNHQSIENIETCYKAILSGPLKIYQSDHPLEQVVKLDLADHLIRSLTNLKKSTTQDKLKKIEADAEELLMRNSHFTGFPMELTIEKNLTKISTSLESLRIIMRVCSKASSALKKIDEDQRKSWEQIHPILSQFHKNLSEYSGILDKEGETYLKSYLSQFKTMLDYPSEVESCDTITEEVKIDIRSDLKDFSKGIEFLVAQPEFSEDTTETEATIELINLKKKAFLHEETVKLRRVLNEALRTKIKPYLIERPLEKLKAE